MKTLLLLAWPIVVSRSTQVVDGVADAIMVTHLGEEAMAATTAGALNSYCALIFPMGVVFIVSSFASQLHGRGDLPSARRYAWYGLGVAALAQLVVFAGLPFLPRVLALVSYAPKVEADMNVYLAARLLSTGFSVGVESFGAYYGGLGDTKRGMRASLVSMVLNIVFNWLLIDGRLGFPALGVKGAALSSVFASFGAFAMLGFGFLREGRGVASGPLKLDEFKRMLRFGLPMGFNWTFEFVAFIAFVNVVVAGLGTSALAGLMSVIQINSVAFMPAFGVASAGSILVGQAVGAGKKDEVPGLVATAMKATMGWMVLASIAYVFAPRLLLLPFVSPDTDGSFMRVATGMLVLSALWQAFDGASITLTECLRATGDVTFSMWARGLIAWGFFLPGSWIGVKVLGGDETTAMLFLLAYLALLAAALTWRFRTGRWREIVLVPEASL